MLAEPSLPCWHMPYGTCHATAVFYIFFQLATIGTKIFDFTGRAKDEDIPQALLFFGISDYILKEVSLQQPIHVLISEDVI